MNTERPPGKTTIDAGVLLTIARLSTLAVNGVSRMGEVPGGVRKVLRRNTDQGVRIDVSNGKVDVEVYVILDANTQLREVSHLIQGEIARAISEMVGMDVGRIDVHIDDVDYHMANPTQDGD